MAVVTSVRSVDTTGIFVEQSGTMATSESIGWGEGGGEGKGGNMVLAIANPHTLILIYLPGIIVVYIVYNSVLLK